MKIKISTGFSLALIFIVHLCHAQFTRDQAKELVLSQLCVNELDHVNIYQAFDLKSGQNPLTLPDSDSVTLPFNTNWVFFIDDNPYAGWAHSCRYIIVNAENGAYFLIYKRFFPTLLNTDFELVSSIPHLNLVPPDPTPYDISQVPENPHLFAVLICGTHDVIFWNDISAIYSTLTTSYGFKKQNIFVHYDKGPNPPNASGNDLDGDMNDEIRYDASKSTIKNTFTGLANNDSIIGIPKLTPEDVLFVFIGDHGDTTVTNPIRSYICLPENERLFPEELADYVKTINCSQMVFLMAQCFSGGFIDDLMNINNNPACKNRYVYTATQAKEVSHQEVWTHDGDAAFFEFVYYWVAAARRHYPHWAQPWRCADTLGNFSFSSYPFTKKPHSPDFNPDSDINKGGNNDLIIQMREAFNYADSMDSWSPHG